MKNIFFNIDARMHSYSFCRSTRQKHQVIFYLCFFLLTLPSCKKKSPEEHEISTTPTSAQIAYPATDIVHNGVEEKYDSDITTYSNDDSSLIVPLKSGDKLYFLLSKFICYMNDSMRPV